MAQLLMTNLVPFSFSKTKWQADIVADHFSAKRNEPPGHSIGISLEFLRKGLKVDARYPLYYYICLIPWNPPISCKVPFENSLGCAEAVHLAAHDQGKMNFISFVEFSHSRVVTALRDRSYNT